MEIICFFSSIPKNGDNFIACSWDRSQPSWKASRNAYIQLIKKWMGEHVVFLSVKQEAFVLSNKGYPVLSNAHEQVVK